MTLLYYLAGWPPYLYPVVVGVGFTAVALFVCHAAERLGDHWRIWWWRR